MHGTYFVETFNTTRLKIFLNQLGNLISCQNETTCKTDIYTVSQDKSQSLILVYSPYLYKEKQNVRPT